MPRLWSDTIDAHREAVREAILDTAWALVTAHGLQSATMSRIAEEAGIGRATLYKYFGDVEAVLSAWHQRHVSGHLDRLAEIRARGGNAGERLESVLEAYAFIAHQRGRHGAELVALLHRQEHVITAQRHLFSLVAELLAEAANAGHVRNDVAPDELANYCLHALAAAGSLASEAAVRRLVAVILMALKLPLE